MLQDKTIDEEAQKILQLLRDEKVANKFTLSLNNLHQVRSKPKYWKLAKQTFTTVYTK
jgi:hypothetical protein